MKNHVAVEGLPRVWEEKLNLEGSFRDVSSEIISSSGVPVSKILNVLCVSVSLQLSRC